MIREGAYARCSRRIYVVVVQVVMLYGSDIWVMKLRIWRVLGGFHHRVARGMTRRQTWRGQDGVWLYPPLEDAMVEAELLELETYVSLRQNTITQFIKTRPIMDLCLSAQRRPGPRVANQWWDQDGL